MSFVITDAWKLLQIFDEQNFTRLGEQKLYHPFAKGATSMHLISVRVYSLYVI